MLPATAFGWGWKRELPRHDVYRLRGHSYHYYGGYFWAPGPFGFWIVNPPIGIAVTVLPPRYTTVIVGGITYYYADTVYYTESTSGYVVVPAPQAAPVVETQTTAPAEMPPGKAISLNIPNSDGSFTEVKLVKYNEGYLGPQGEYYKGKPTVDQLRVLYGK